MNSTCKKHANCTMLAIAPVGEVHFISSKRARNLSITVRHDSSIRVTIPKGMNLTIARKFFESKIDWVRRYLTKIERQNRQNQPLLELSDAEQRKAKIYLPQRLAYLADKYGFTYNRIYIRNQRTRWGSCSSRDNISLNMKLVRLPLELQNYVILHELVHTKHKNHSKKFWQALDKLVGDSKKLKRQMRKYRLR